MNDQETAARALPLAVRLLQEKTLAIAKRPCTYRLFVSTGCFPQYYVALSSLQEGCEACVGNSQAMAEILFLTLVRGRVTPCTLPDVLQTLYSC